ncbi:transcription factor TT8-like [Salvia divinorum]|uniref:Transcription factor TT8-like n=1 Tax=Salvia divinorum TaxID=28513 RepID=A0ABD1GZF4_SALDI
MEGYNDSTIPPLSYFSTPEIPNNEQNSHNLIKMQEIESQRKQGERKRMDQLNENFSLLQSMVPSRRQVQQRKDTRRYSKLYQMPSRRGRKIGRSEEIKCRNQNSVIPDSAVFLAIQLPSRRGSELDILRVLHRHEAEVMDARINVSVEKVMTFTATVKLAGSSIGKMRQDILTSLD